MAHSIYIYAMHEYMYCIDFYWHLFISTFNLSFGHGPLPARPFPKVFGKVVMGRGLRIHHSRDLGADPIPICSL